MTCARILCLALLAIGCGNKDWGVTGSDLETGASPDHGGWDIPPGTDLAGVDLAGIDLTEPSDIVSPKDPGVDPSDPGFPPIDEGPDLTKPQVISAFSSDGKSVTVRFSERLEASGANTAANFSVKGSDGSTIPVLQAAQKDVFVTLTLDPSKTINPALTYEVWVSDVKDEAGNPLDPKAKTAKIKRSAYVAIVWHQHQPYYVDVARDEMSGPWVRKHATKDYYDMAAILAQYPDVHVTINLTAVLLNQLITYYLERLEPYVDIQANTVDEAAFLAKWRGHTDPWIDLLLDDTPDPEGIVAPKPTDRQIELFYNSPWTCLSTSDQMMAFFPEYQALRDRAPTTYTHDDLLLLKILFEIAWFDPDFLNGPVKMPDGLVVDLSDIVKKDAAGRFTLRVPPSEELANRLVAENYKVMRNVIPIHKQLRYDPKTRSGQIEISTTPYYHPILPLLVNTDLAKENMPDDAMPSPAYQYPADALAHVGKAVKLYQDLFGAEPLGMWPGEGSVADEVVSAFTKYGVRWIATDQGVLANSLGNDKPSCYQCKPYRLGGTGADALSIVFRDTGLSNKIGFTFQGYYGQAAAAEFMKDIGAMAPPFGGGDRLITVILDGENAWESYSKEHDGKGFFHALYQSLQDGYEMGEVVPVTVAEYILGNPDRHVPEHPIDGLQKLNHLSAGSWIGGSFAVWIGEAEENAAWGYLSQTRKALETSGIPAPNPSADKPTDKNSTAYFNWLAWEELYAAEGSDWFWWYGEDMTSPANDDSPFDMAFRSHLNGMYEAMNQSLIKQGKSAVPVPNFKPLVQPKPKSPTGPFKTPPVIDGELKPTEAEWTTEGGLFRDNDSGAMADPNDDVAMVYYGYTADAFYCALVFNEDLSKKTGSNYGVSIYLSHKHILDALTGKTQQNPFNTTDRYGQDLAFVTDGAAWEVFVDFTTKPVKVGLFAADGKGAYKAATGAVEVGGPVNAGKLLEFKIPLASIGLTLGDPLEFAAVVGENGQAIDRAPNLNGKMVFEDATNLKYVTFQVDCTGSKIKLDMYTAIKNPPPPAGKGIAYIAGNHDKLGNWIPNKIGLRDDGKPPDAKAGDNLWTGAFGFMPGTLIKYKYTIGIPTDEGKWGGTEEFPLTERAFTVTKDAACKGMFIQDIFADRPQPTGTMAPNAKVDPCTK